VEDYVRTDAFDAVLTHNRYSLVDRTGETIIRLAAERGMLVFNAAPFGGGILAGSSTRGATYAYADASPGLLEYIERVHRTCAEHDVNIASAALRFSLREPRIHSTVVGVYSRRRLDELGDLLDEEIPEELWTSLEELGAPPASPTD
jgi:D-threo-aldose 1-dehydrogenase